MDKKIPIPQTIPIKMFPLKMPNNTFNKSNTVSTTTFYLLYLIYKCDGFVYYRECSIAYKTLFIEGLEVNNKSYSINDLKNLGMSYVKSKYNEELVNELIMSNRLPFYGIIIILDKNGYKIDFEFNKKLNDIYIKCIEKDDEKIEHSELVVEGRKAYNYILSELLKLYKRKGKIPKF